MPGCCRCLALALSCNSFLSAGCWRDFHHYNFHSAVLPEGCANYKVLDDFRRDVNYTATEDLTDEGLQPGWYRFLLNGTNAVMPTFYVRVSRHCRVLLFKTETKAVHLYDNYKDVTVVETRSELRSWVIVEVDVLGSPSLMVLNVVCGRKATLNLNLRHVLCSVQFGKWGGGGVGGWGGRRHSSATCVALVSGFC